MFERLKTVIQSDLGISPDVVFVAAGLVLFVVTSLIFRKPFAWPWALLPGIIVSIVIEAVEIRAHYGLRGLADQSGSGLAGILLRHSRDFLVMNLAPLTVVIVANLWFRGTGE